MKTPYRIRKRKNPRDMEAPAMYYPTPFYSDMISTEMLSEEISHATTLTPADVSAVLTALSARIIFHIESGSKVKLDNFGIFKLAFSGKGRKEKSGVHARDIDDVHILFTPEAKLKRLIKRFSFVKKDL